MTFIIDSSYASEYADSILGFYNAGESVQVRKYVTTSGTEIPVAFSFHPRNNNEEIGEELNGWVLAYRNDRKDYTVWVKEDCLAEYKEDWGKKKDEYDFDFESFSPKHPFLRTYEFHEVSAPKETSEYHQRLLGEERSKAFELLVYSAKEQFQDTDLLEKEYLRRGLTASERKNCPAVAIVPGEFDIPEEIPVNLMPGVLSGFGGKKRLNTSVKAGVLFPFPDVFGRVAGAQIRWDNDLFKDSGAKGKTTWLSHQIDGATASRNEHGEPPLAVFRPSVLTNLDIVLCEGTGFKPYLLAERTGSVVIGASGGSFASSVKTLREAINTIAAQYRKYKDTHPDVFTLRGMAKGAILIAPDGGFALNYQVSKKIFQLGESLLTWAKSGEIDYIWSKIPTVCFWGQAFQVGDAKVDADEIPYTGKPGRLRFDTMCFEYFKVEYFKVCGGLGKSGNSQLTHWAKSYSAYTVNIAPKPEKYLSVIEPAWLESCDLLCINKDLGGGKTTAVFKYLNTLPEETIALCLGYRNVLSRNTVARANSFVEPSTGESLPIKAVHTEKGEFTGYRFYAGCIDSYSKFLSILNNHLSANPKGDYVVILDEIVSVLQHLFKGRTLKTVIARNEAIEAFEKMVRGASKVICLDANLTDFEVDFLRSIFADKKINTFLSEPSPDANPYRNITFLSERKDDGTRCKAIGKAPVLATRKAIELLKAGQKVLFLSDSKNQCANFNKLASGQGVPAHRSFRLDSDNSGSPEAAKFLDNPTEFIASRDLRTLSLSPSGNSGLDIPDPKEGSRLFDAIILCVTGTLDVKGLAQLLGRYRNTEVPVYIACPEFINDKVDLSVIHRCQEAALRARTNNLLEASLGDGSFGEDMARSLESIVKASLSVFLSPWNKLYCDYANLKATENKFLRICLQEFLRAKGHKIVNEFVEIKLNDKKVHKEIKEAVQTEEGTAIFNAPELTEEEYSELKEKEELPLELRHQRDRYKLSKVSLPGVETVKDNDGYSLWTSNFCKEILCNPQNRSLLKERERFLVVTQGKPEILVALAKTELKSAIWSQIFDSDTMFRSDAAQLKVLTKVGFTDLLKGLDKADTFGFEYDYLEFLPVIKKICKSGSYLKTLNLAEPKINFKALEEEDSNREKLEGRKITAREANRLKKALKASANSKQALTYFLNKILSFVGLEIISWVGDDNEKVKSIAPKKNYGNLSKEMCFEGVLECIDSLLTKKLSALVETVNNPEFNLEKLHQNRRMYRTSTIKYEEEVAEVNASVPYEQKGTEDKFEILDLTYSTNPSYSSGLRKLVGIAESGKLNAPLAGLVNNLASTEFSKSRALFLAEAGEGIWKELEALMAEELTSGLAYYLGSLRRALG